MWHSGDVFPFRNEIARSAAIESATPARSVVEGIAAVAERGSFTGVQFHPDKSGAAGARFLESLCLSLV